MLYKYKPILSGSYIFGSVEIFTKQLLCVCELTGSLKSNYNNKYLFYHHSCRVPMKSMKEGKVCMPTWLNINFLKFVYVIVWCSLPSLILSKWLPYFSVILEFMFSCNLFIDGLLQDHCHCVTHKNFKYFFETEKQAVQFLHN